jgi:hypothetical protein
MFHHFSGQNPHFPPVLAGAKVLMINGKSAPMKIAVTSPRRILSKGFLQVPCTPKSMAISGS